MQFVLYEIPANKPQRCKRKTLLLMHLLTESADIMVWMTNGATPQDLTARFDRLPWFSYHSADAVPIEGTVL